MKMEQTTLTYIVLGRPRCPYCERAKEALDASSVQHAYYDLYEHPWLLTLVKDAGYTTVPQIYDSNGRHIGGFEDLQEHLK